MPIKAIVSGVEKDIKRIPMKGRNLYTWPYTSTWGIDGAGQNRTVYNTAYTRSSVVKLKPNTQYTLSAKASGAIDYYCRIAIFDEEPQIGSVSTHYYFSNNDNSTTFTTGADEEWGIVVQNQAAASSIDLKRMLNEGSTPLPYEPYGYQEGWEVRDNQNRLIWGREETLTGTGSISFKGAGIPLKSVDIFGNTQQTGTPSPDNIIMPEFCGKLVGTDWTIPISCAGQTVPVYLGQTQTVRRIRKLVLTGEETYVRETAYNRFYTEFPNAKINGLRLTQIYCTHFLSVYDGRPLADVPNNSIYSNSYSAESNKFFIKTTEYTTADDFKAYLSQQYAAGTPVTVWYVLAEPETGIVNEPLAKIGDYADKLHSTTPIPTVKGANVLTVDTTLPPSNTSITGHITSAS